MSREPWSVNALSLALGPDRRTIVKWLERAAVKPAADGPKGPLFGLRDAVGVLSDAGLLGDRGRAGTWRFQWGGALASREIVGRVRLALAKRLPDDVMRAVREVLAAELLRYIGQCEKQIGWKRNRADAPDWSSLDDAALARALEALVEVGQLQEGE